MGKIVNGKLLYSTGRSAQCDDLEGWDGGGVEGGSRGRDICIFMADSHCCMEESNTTLKSNCLHLKIN